MDDFEFNGKVFVPSNLKKNKQTVIFNFSFRDLLYLAIIIVIAIPIYLSLKNIDPSVAITIAIIPSLFIAFIAFKKWNNMNFEEYVFYKYSNQVKSKPKRINSSENIYEVLENKKVIISERDASQEKHLYTGIDSVDKIIYKSINFFKTRKPSNKQMLSKKTKKTSDSQIKRKVVQKNNTKKSKYIKYM